MTMPKAYDPQYGYKYQILTRLPGYHEWEHLDHAVDKKDKNYLLQEYRMCMSVYEIKVIPLPRHYWSDNHEAVWYGCGDVMVLIAPDHTRYERGRKFWTYRVALKGKNICKGDDYSTPGFKKKWEAAEGVISFLMSSYESLWREWGWPDIDQDMIRDYLKIKEEDRYIMYPVLGGKLDDESECEKPA